MAFFRTGELDAVRAYYGNLTGSRTPLVRLQGLARELGVADVLVKDESNRFGLPAFKIVGARYAISRLLEEQPGVRGLTAATAGNHGRAVARVARQHGLRADIYVPIGTEPFRVHALESEGAHVTVTTVAYDETVRMMARDATAHDRTIVSDTAWPGYEQIPRWIMAGYTWILEEAASQWDAVPDAIVVQAGVGGLAGAVAGWLQARFGESRPRLIIAEPEGAACVGASLAAGTRVSLPWCAPTAMVGLRCAEVSSIAWPVLRDVADGAIGVSESLSQEAMRRLASPSSGDPAIDAGPSGACGIAALMALMRNDDFAPVRTRLGINHSARVLTVVTEAGR